MARIRTIKPELFTHDDLYAVERDSGLPVIRCFIGLWTQADREGRFKWKPERLKVAIAPYDNIDFSRVLHALWSRGFILKYRAAGEEYGYIPSWSKNQVINNREAGSTLPDPSNSMILSPDKDATFTREAREDHAGQGERKGKEGKGKEGSVGLTLDAHATGDEASEVKPQAAIELLNQICHRQFKGAKTDLAFARARIREGWTLSEMKTVFQYKFNEWSTDPKMHKFLQPSTLLGNKFESYYQAATNGVKEIDFEETIKNELSSMILQAGMTPPKPGVPS